MATPLDHTASLPASAGWSAALWLYRFDGDGRAHPCDAATCDAGALRQPPGDDWHWLHLDLSDVRSAQIVALLALPEEAQATLVSPDTHVNLQLEDTVAHGVFVDWCTSAASIRRPKASCAATTASAGCISP